LCQLHLHFSDGIPYLPQLTVMGCAVGNWVGLYVSDGMISVTVSSGSVVTGSGTSDIPQ